MQPKDSKKTKTTNLQVNSGAKNKRNEINTLINKLINRNKTSRATNDNNKLYQKLKETKYNKTARDTGKKRKKNESNYPTRSVNYEKSSTNIAPQVLIGKNITYRFHYGLYKKAKMGRF